MCEGCGSGTLGEMIVACQIMVGLELLLTYRSCKVLYLLEYHAMPYRERAAVPLLG